jgi:hypothetical protein
VAIVQLAKSGSGRSESASLHPEQCSLVRTANRARLFPVAIGMEEGLALRECVRKERAQRTLETGLGFAISTPLHLRGIARERSGGDVSSDDEGAARTIVASITKPLRGGSGGHRPTMPRCPDLIEPGGHAPRHARERAISWARKNKGGSVTGFDVRVSEATATPQAGCPLSVRQSWVAMVDWHYRPESKAANSASLASLRGQDPKALDHLAPIPLAHRRTWARGLTGTRHFEAS